MCAIRIRRGSGGTLVGERLYIAVKEPMLGYA